MRTGDVVVLKSGGPPMTVRKELLCPGTWFAVDWFDDTGRHSSSYHADQLVPHVTDVYLKEPPCSPAEPS